MRAVAQRIFSILSISLLILPVFVLAPNASAQTGWDAGTPANIQAYRSNFEQLLGQYEEIFLQMANARGLELIQQAREALGAVTSESLVDTGVPDLSAAVSAAAALAEQLRDASTAGPADLAAPASGGFPGAPPILADCNNILHDSAFTLGALIAWQALRAIIAGAEFVCLESILGVNTSLVCVPLVVAADAAAIPFELADFCAGEEDSALLAGSFDRLAHIHDDLAAAQTAIIANDNANANAIVSNDNANTAALVALLATLQAGVDANGGKLDTLLDRQLEVIRLLHTPEGRRTSAVPACNGAGCDFPNR